jgi:hypothetical protein
MADRTAIAAATGERMSATNTVAAKPVPTLFSSPESAQRKTTHAPAMAVVE